VIREAMARRGKAGIARIVLYRRERPVMIEPFRQGLLLTTLRYDKTVRKPEEVFDGLGTARLDDELIELASHIIDTKQAAFDPSHFEDRYEDALLALIEAKRKGKAPPVVQSAEPPSNVVNLFEALKKSLAGTKDGATGSAGGRRAKTGKTKPAAETAAKRGTKAARKSEAEPRKSEAKPRKSAAKTRKSA
jgi:DNA end-binding protein Ku